MWETHAVIKCTSSTGYSHTAHAFPQQAMYEFTLHMLGITNTDWYCCPMKGAAHLSWTVAWSGAVVISLNTSRLGHQAKKGTHKQEIIGNPGFWDLKKSCFHTWSYCNGKDHLVSSSVSFKAVPCQFGTVNQHHCLVEAVTKTNSYNSSPKDDWSIWFSVLGTKQILTGFLLVAHCWKPVLRKHWEGTGIWIPRLISSSFYSFLLSAW